MNICGDPDFNGPVTSSWQPASGNRWLDCGGSNPSWQSAGDPKYAAPLTMPPSNTTLKRDADGSSAAPGACTRADRRSPAVQRPMNVTSPFTKVDQPRLRAGLEPHQPTNGVIYVQNVPSDPSDPNYTSAARTAGPTGADTRTRRTCPVPIVGDLNSCTAARPATLRRGQPQGTADDRDRERRHVVGNTKYAGGMTGTDMLGLIANGQVKSSTRSTATDNDPSCDMTRKAGTRFNGSLPGGTSWATRNQRRDASVQQRSSFPTTNAGSPRGR